MLGRLQRRPGPGAPASARLRCARNWSLVIAALSALFYDPSGHRCLAASECRAAVVSGGMLGVLLAGARLLIARRDSNAVRLTEGQQERLLRLVTATAVGLVVGYAASLVTAAAGIGTWVPVWPGLFLGWLCGIAAVEQPIAAVRDLAR